MRYFAVVGRILFSAIFVTSAPSHFLAQTIGYAGGQGVPFAHVLVPLSGALELVGGLSVLLGYKAQAGAWLLVLFLVPVTLMMHNFWAVKDSGMVVLQQAMFMKNVALLGTSLLIAYFGAGPLSMDARLEQRSRA